MSEKCRQWLKLSIVFLFTMGVFCFLLIFLIGLAQNHVLKNNINSNVPIQQS